MFPSSLALKDRQAIEEFSRRLAPLLGDKLLRLALFGSKLEGRDTAESDIDLLVLIKDPAAPLRNDILDLAFEVNLKYGVYLSPRIISQSIFDHSVWRLTPFLQRLRQNSVSV